MQFPPEVLEDLLCAVSVSGVKSESTRRYLLQHDLKNFEQTLDIASKFGTGGQERRQTIVTLNCIDSKGKRMKVVKKKTEKESE